MCRAVRTPSVEYLEWEPTRRIPLHRAKGSTLLRAQKVQVFWRVLFVVSKLCDGIFFVVRKPYTQTRPSAHACNCFVILSLPRARKFVYIIDLILSVD